MHGIRRCDLLRSDVYPSDLLLAEIVNQQRDRIEAGPVLGDHKGASSSGPFNLAGHPEAAEIAAPRALTVRDKHFAEFTTDWKDDIRPAGDCIEPRTQAVDRNRVLEPVIVAGIGEVADELKLSELVDQLSLAPERVAIELNQKVVRRNHWSGTMLADGDRIEIVHFVGGGRMQ